MQSLLPYRDRYGYHSLASGGIGWGLPASVGASLANPDRPVVCYTGDGSAMYTFQALWTAAHHKLPLTVVIVNNGGYRIIKQRLLSFHKSNRFVGMDFANPARRLLRARRRARRARRACRRSEAPPRGARRRRSDAPAPSSSK